MSNGFKLTTFDQEYSVRLQGGMTWIGGSSGSNSGYVGGDVVGGPGDLSVVGLRSSVSLASNFTPVSLGDVLTIIQASPAVARFATPSNSGLAFGSNAMDVSGRDFAGTTGTYIGANHEHLGVALITASSSNNMQRPTVNLRAGANVAFGLTDSDGNGSFDTLTISAVGTNGGTVAGSVGSFATDGSGNGTAFTTSSATFVDITGASITITTQARRVKVGFQGVWSVNSTTAIATVTVNVDGVDQGGNAGYWRMQTLGNNALAPLTFIWMTPTALSAGSHTFKIRVLISAGTFSLKNDTGGATWNMWVEESPT